MRGKPRRSMLGGDFTAGNGFLAPLRQEAGMRPCISSIVALVLLSFSSPARGADAPPVAFRGKTFAEWRTLLNNGDPKTRGRAATALGLGPFGETAVPPLLDALRD